MAMLGHILWMTTDHNRDENNDDGNAANKSPIRLLDWELTGLGSGPQDLGQYILSNMEPYGTIGTTRLRARTHWSRRDWAQRMSHGAIVGTNTQSEEWNGGCGFPCTFADKAVYTNGRNTFTIRLEPLCTTITSPWPTLRSLDPNGVETNTE
jgi:hypothetical protein